MGYGPHRSESSKWRVTFKEYPHEKYPDFCLGSSGSILNRKALSLLLAQINRTPFLWLEDVFTIGLLRANAGIKITSLEAKKTLIGPISLKPKQIQGIWDLHRRRTLTSWWICKFVVKYILTFDVTSFDGYRTWKHSYKINKWIMLSLSMIGLVPTSWKLPSSSMKWPMHTCVSLESFDCTSSKWHTSLHKWALVSLFTTNFKLTGNDK